MAIRWTYTLKIVVDDSKQPTFHQKLEQYLTNAKTSGEIIEAVGEATADMVPVKVEIT